MAAGQPLYCDSVSGLHNVRQFLICFPTKTFRKPDRKSPDDLFQALEQMRNCFKDLQTSVKNSLH